MKKKYIAPVIAVEHYELTQTIASCVTKIGLLDSECVIKDPDATDDMKDLAYENWFTSGVCLEAAVGMDEYDKICYHTNANAAFNS